jgi:hypothetical protein
MPKQKKSAKTRSNKFTKTEGDVENAIKTSKKLELELKKIKKDIKWMWPHRHGL